MSSEKLGPAERALAGLELGGRIVFWLVMFVPCTILFLIAAGIGAVRAPRAERR
jgi:hypothetical protein